MYDHDILYAQNMPQVSISNTVFADRQYNKQVTKVYNIGIRSVWQITLQL